MLQIRIRYCSSAYWIHCVICPLFYSSLIDWFGGLYMHQYMRIQLLCDPLEARNTLLANLKFATLLHGLLITWLFNLLYFIHVPHNCIQGREQLVYYDVLQTSSPLYFLFF
jgi:hypothetical protein